MDCPTCIPLLEREVMKIDGVEDSRGNYMTKILKVTYDASRVQLAEIETAIERVGYRIAYKKYPGPLSNLKELFNKDSESKVIKLLDFDFPGKVLHSSKKVAVMFSSQNCPTCSIFKHEFMKIADKLKEVADFYLMDISNTETWRKYDILSIPTVIIFQEGKILEIFTAMPDADDVKSALEA
jgi:copper chaperone CopZ